MNGRTRSPRFAAPCTQGKIEPVLCPFRLAVCRADSHLHFLTFTCRKETLCQARGPLTRQEPSRAGQKQNSWGTERADFPQHPARIQSPEFQGALRSGQVLPSEAGTKSLFRCTPNGYF
ncbi:hypothetical protein CLOSTMETH_00320 [[Clostridium] methylpentosum DSM 5476]|uniref:Uncharacterized protein n=1 Tax=[Clostridium] methylpentosum DSM 5476 TaxID=537013 RepID=C0E925_9FIRM|nr:hypothetical protein CLOSTMETH_00320 [[Clostridium] methylpentosum DSM 5476]